MRDGLMASMSVTAARWFWSVFWLGIGEAHLALLL
jgi:hypothetical protein